jgi:hypothetical protein
MKRFAYLMLAIAFVSCSKETVGTVELDLDYSFFRSGSMTRSQEASYGAFYDEYIESKTLTPQTYDITFVNRENKAVTNVSGRWDDQGKIKLPVGTYDVIGTSYPMMDEIGAPSDTVYLSFTSAVEVTQDMNSLNLPASYDSYLLLFNSSTYASVRIKESYAGGVVKYRDVNAYGDAYAVFMTDTGWNEKILSLDLELTDNDGSTTDVDLEKIDFQKGNYYHFNDMSYLFSIPQMNNGNF